MVEGWGGGRQPPLERATGETVSLREPDFGQKKNLKKTFEEETEDIKGHANE